MDWKFQLARLEFKLIGIEELPQLAAAALKEGTATPALSRLAGLGGAAPEAIRKTFKTFLAEAGIAAPPRQEAAWLAIRAVLDAIIAGQLAPFDGLVEIFWDFCSDPTGSAWAGNPGDSADLAELKRLFLAYDAILEDRTARWSAEKENETLLREYEDEIRLEAARLRQERFGY
jgi:hypothetical protein